MGVTHLVDIDKPLQEKCGIVVMFSPKPKKLLGRALVAASALQHRGLNGAGIAIQTASKRITFTGEGLLKEVFTHKKMQQLNKTCSWIMTHCRYGTFGGYDRRNLQPCRAVTKKGEEVSVVHNGEFVEVDTIKKAVGFIGKTDVSDTYLFTKLLVKTEGVSWDEKIVHILQKVNGAYSLFIGVNDAVYIARDPQAIRPLIIGKFPDGTWMAASETHAFDKVGVKVIRSLEPGEIIKIDATGLKFLQKGKSAGGHFCDFEWAYFSRPDSLFPTHKNSETPDNWLSVGAFRHRCGEIIAQENPLRKADFIVGVPESGINVGIGFSQTLKLPYRQLMIRDHFDSNGEQRLFMRDDEMKKIKRKVLGKISFVPDFHFWKNAIVVLSDDSIVRGNVSQQITKMAFQMGAREVHWIVGFPPVRFPCHLGVSMRTGEELIASKYKGDMKKIARAIGATSITYISPKGFIQARFLNGKKLLQLKDEREIFLTNLGCGGCVTGLYPVNKNGTVYQTAQ